MEKNIYSISDNYKRDILSGKTPIGSIISVKFGSGNSTFFRFHGLSETIKGNIRVCNMSWDNLATETRSLDNVLITKVVADNDYKEFLESYKKESNDG